MRCLHAIARSQSREDCQSIQLLPTRASDVAAAGLSRLSACLSPPFIQLDISEHADGVTEDLLIQLCLSYIQYACHLALRRSCEGQ